MAEYAIMPAEDYLDACDAVREKTGGTEVIKSGEMGGLIRSISGGDTSVEDAIITRTIGSYSNDRVTDIGDYVFYQCTDLITVDFPMTTRIGAYAFSGCKNLTTINFPNVTKLVDYAFHNCPGLTGVAFPSIPSLANSVFRLCEGLIMADFTLVSNIASYTFYGCSALTALCIRKTDAICTLGYTVSFSGTPIASGTGYIYVPAALIEDYKVATNWSTYAAQFRALEDYTVDGTVTGELDKSKI